MPGVLEKQIKKRNKVTNPTQKKRVDFRDLDLPVYGEYGDVSRRSLKPPNWLIGIILVVVLYFVILYVPAFIYEKMADKEPTYNGKPISEIYYINPNAEGIRSYNEYLQEHPDLDFDGDGLSNGQEERQGTNPRKPDTDGDGISDYLEMYVYNTNPTSSNGTLATLIKNETTSSGKSVNSPVKINDVVLWPNDWNSRAYGSVVKTMKGYRFCNFKGWAQFPTGSYAYRIEKGVHVMLEYRAEEKAYKIDGDWEVFLYPEKLPTEYEFSAFGKKTLMEEGFGAKFLAFLLPARSGLLACRQITKLDETQETKILVSLTPKKMSLANLPEERFGRNMNYLSDLATVYTTLNEGRCLLVSIYVANEGEVIFEIYGYDDEGSLLVAEPQSGSPMGKITIEERVSRIMMKDGEGARNVEWFYFKGCGFNSSKKYTKIYFFGGENS